jgi:hypothetical protein
VSASAFALHLDCSRNNVAKQPTSMSRFDWPGCDQDAARTCASYKKGNTMKYQIWYMKPSFLRGVVGSSPDLNNLPATHVHLKDIEADNQEDALCGELVAEW